MQRHLPPTLLDGRSPRANGFKNDSKLHAVCKCTYITHMCVQYTCACRCKNDQNIRYTRHVCVFSWNTGTLRPLDRVRQVTCTAGGVFSLMLIDLYFGCKEYCRSNPMATFYACQRSNLWLRPQMATESQAHPFFSSLPKDMQSFTANSTSFVDLRQA